MQLALLLGANPKTFKTGPIVRLPAGSWVVRVHGINSSVLALYTDEAEIMELGKTTTLNIGAPTDVHVVPKVRGVEDYLTVLAES